MQTLLDANAVTAFRLSLDNGESGDRVLMARMFSAWNAIDPLGPKQNPADLPDTMRHEGEFVISTTTYEPICLSDENALSEIFRLTSLRKAPDKDGWHNHSNIVRTANAIGFTRQLAERDPPQNLTATLRKHQMIEMREARTVLLVRPVHGKARRLSLQSLSPRYVPETFSLANSKASHPLAPAIEHWHSFPLI